MIENMADALNEAYDFGLVRQPQGIYVTTDHLAFLFNGFEVLVFYAMDQFEPSPVMAEIAMGILPEINTARLELMAAMLDESDEPEVIAAIDSERDVLEALVTVFAQTPADVVREQLEMVEALVAESDDEAFIAAVYPDLEMIRAMVMVLEHPGLHSFTQAPVRDADDDTPVGGPGFGFVLHTENDTKTFLNATWPGLIEQALEVYSVFLERVLTLPAGSLG